jgi:L-xylulokinase
MAEFFLSIDAGGTAVKAAVFSASGEEVGVAARTPRFLSPHSGHAERDPEEMWRHVGEAVPRALASAGVTADEVAVVGVTGFGNGLFLVDGDGRPTMNGILASDIRAAGICEEWTAEGLGAEHVARTGQTLWPGKPAPLLAWLGRHRPEVLQASAAALMCKDFLRLRLTGERAAEVTDQSTGSLVGLDRDYAADLLADLSLGGTVRLLPPLIEPLTIAGAVTAKAAAETGLRAGTPVAAGCCDNLAVMYGTGAVGDDRIVVMSGTWGLHQAFLPAPVTDGRVLISAHGLRPGEWLAIEGSPTSASSLEWFVEAFLKPLSGDVADLHGFCNRLVAEAAEDGPPVYFLPFLNGAIDNAAARGSFLGFSSWHRLGHAVRALYEGVAFEHRRHLERLLSVREPPVAVRFAGGAAKSRTWAEIFAATLGLTLEVPAGSEFGARGAALVAAAVLGRFDGPEAAAAGTRIDRVIAPDPALRAKLDRRYAGYRTLIDTLAPAWKEVAP